MASMVRNLIAGMSDREQKMAALMVLVLFLLMVFLAVFLVSSSIGDLEVKRLDQGELLRFINAKEQEYIALKKEVESSLTKARSKPTPLRTLVDNVVKKTGVSDPDTKELSDQHHGERWVEHAVEVSMRQVGLENLTKFMEEVEGNRRKFPIAITKLEIRKRRMPMDQYDVKMTISTYEIMEVLPGSSAKKGGKAVKKGGRQ